jgi:hypothetical protein
VSKQSHRLWARLVRSLAVPYSTSERQLIESLFRRHWENLEQRYLLSGSPPAVFDLHLLYDTGTAGDNVTSNPTVVGRISNDDPPAAFPVEFDVNGDGAAEGTVYSATDSSAAFVIDLSNNVFAPGAVTVRVRAGEPAADGWSTIYGSWSSFSFTYALDNGSGGEHEHVPPGAAPNGTFRNPRLDPQAPAPSAMGPSSFNGGSLPPMFDAFGSRFYLDPFDNFSITDSGGDSDDWTDSDSLGNYSYSLDTTFQMSLSGSHDEYGGWGYVESRTDTYSFVTIFSGFDGSHWELSQWGSKDFAIDAYGGEWGSHYVASQNQSDNFSFSWSLPSTPTFSKSYSSGGSQQYSFTADGSSSPGWTSEFWHYDAYGSEGFSDGQSDAAGSGANSSNSAKGDSGSVNWQLATLPERHHLHRRQQQPEKHHVHLRSHDGKLVVRVPEQQIRRNHFFRRHFHPHGHAEQFKPERQQADPAAPGRLQQLQHWHLIHLRQPQL